MSAAFLRRCEKLATVLRSKQEFYETALAITVESRQKLLKRIERFRELHERMTAALNICKDKRVSLEDRMEQRVEIAKLRGELKKLYQSLPGDKVPVPIPRQKRRQPKDRAAMQDKVVALLRKTPGMTVAELANKTGEPVLNVGSHMSYYTGRLWTADRVGSEMRWTLLPDSEPTEPKQDEVEHALAEVAAKYFAEPIQGRHHQKLVKRP